MSIWLYKPYKTNLSSAFDIALTAKVVKDAVHWMFVSAGKHRLKVNDLTREDNKKFKRDGFLKLALDAKELGESFKSYVQSGLLDLESRKTEETKANGQNNRTFESTLHSMSNEALLAFENSEFGSAVRDKVESLVGSKYKLRCIQLHLNLPSETKAVFSQGNNEITKHAHFGYHADNNINTIKAMAYLSIENSDGAFQYVKGSHLFTNIIEFAFKRAVRQNGMIKNTEESLIKIMSLPSFMRFKSEISAFSEKSRVADIVCSNASTITAKNGDVIIFDPIGLHKGGLVKKNRRVALQLIYSPEKDLWSV